MLDSFLPFSILLVLRAVILYTQYSYYTYIDQWTVWGIGIGIGVLLAIVLISWLCVSGYKYLERKGRENDTTALTAVCVVFVSIIFGVFLVGIPNSTFIVDKKVARYEIQSKYERHHKYNDKYQVSISIDGEKHFIEVLPDVYDECDVGDVIEVEIAKGLFGLEYLCISQR